MLCDPVKLWCLFYRRTTRPKLKKRFSSKDMSFFWSSFFFLLLAVLWKTLPDLFTTSHTPSMGGFVHPAFEEVKEIFKNNVESGREPGATFAVYHNGEALVDIWGGYADADAKSLWQEKTLSQAWSSTKGVTAVVMAMLVDRGLLDYNEKIQTYWPEFGQNGKSNITVGMLLSHQGGLVSVGRQLSLLEYRDNWTEIERLMAKQKPAWPPGTRCSYHAYTFGMYADAIIRRVDPKHRNISQFFSEEIAKPFDLDFYIGLPLDQNYRAARGSYVSTMQMLVSLFLWSPSRWAMLPEVFLGHVMQSSLNVFDLNNDMNVMNDPELRSIGLSSAIGFGTARALARMYDYLANGGAIEGKQLLSCRQIVSLSTPVTQNIPVLVGSGAPFSMGMIVEKNLAGQPVFGHRGYGGQNCYADPQYGIGVAYITNFNSVYSISDDPRAADLLRVLYKCMNEYKKKQENKQT